MKKILFCLFVGMVSVAAQTPSASQPAVAPASAAASKPSTPNTLPTVSDNTASNNIADPLRHQTPNQIFSGIVNLEFSNMHLTARGLNLQNQGLVTQQKLTLFARVYRAPDPKADLNEITLSGSFWSEVDSQVGGVEHGNFSEMDPSIGFNVIFLRDWAFESPFIWYISETDTFQTACAWDPRLTYHDHFLPSFAFNPYVEYFQEIANKTTIVFNRNYSHSSNYGVLGFDPTYAFTTIPLKLELPSYLSIVSSNFYQRHNNTGGGSGLGLVSTMFKATVPLRFINPSYGKWSFYAGVQYDYLNNPGLLDGNEYKGAGKGNRDRSLVQYHTGITLIF